MGNKLELTLCHAIKLIAYLSDMPVSGVHCTQVSSILQWENLISYCCTSNYYFAHFSCLVHSAIVYKHNQFHRSIWFLIRDLVWKALLGCWLVNKISFQDGWFYWCESNGLSGTHTKKCSSVSDCVSLQEQFVKKNYSKSFSHYMFMFHSF